MDGSGRCRGEQTEMAWSQFVWRIANTTRYMTSSNRVAFIEWVAQTRNHRLASSVALQLYQMAHCAKIDLHFSREEVNQLNVIIAGCDSTPDEVSV